MKRITVLGSTGSIGRAALEVISLHPDKFTVVGLAAGKNIDLLEKQIMMFRPDIVGVADGAAASRLRERIGLNPEIVSGEKGISSVAAFPDIDIVLSALVGFSGLVPTLHAVRAGKIYRACEQRGPCRCRQCCYGGGKEAWRKDTSGRQ